MVFVFICSLTIISSVASARTAKSKVTVGSAPTFRCSDRAEKRREVMFYWTFNSSLYSGVVCFWLTTLVLSVESILCFLFLLPLWFFYPVLSEVRGETSSSWRRKKPVWGKEKGIVVFTPSAAGPPTHVWLFISLFSFLFVSPRSCNV